MIIATETLLAVDLEISDTIRSNSTGVVGARKCVLYPFSYLNHRTPSVVVTVVPPLDIKRK